MTYAFDPELAPIIGMIPVIDWADAGAARAALVKLRSMAGRPPALDVSGIDISDVQVPVRDGTEVLVRLYRPARRSGVTGALLHIHGGGFITGDLDSEAGDAVALVRELGIVVASVDYKLAPEHPYPAALDDCMTALAWLHGEALKLNIDRTRIGVFGKSAGGTLAAAVALRTRDEAGPLLCFQFLGLPTLDDRLDTPSMRQFVDTPILTRYGAVGAWKNYLGSLSGDIPEYAAPARAKDLRGLPAAYINAMEFDPLRDEAISFAARLLEAGVTVELHVYPGTFHGSHAVAPGAAVSRRLQAETIEAVRRGLRLSVGPEP